MLIILPPQIQMLKTICISLTILQSLDNITDYFLLLFFHYTFCTCNFYYIIVWHVILTLCKYNTALMIPWGDNSAHQYYINPDIIIIIMASFIDKTINSRLAFIYNGETIRLIKSFMYFQYIRCISDNLR